ncbi:MAG: metallophosphoesterase, partial [Nannocystaceae bacterium]
MTLRMAVFFFVMPLLWVALHGYVGRRLIADSGLRTAWKRVAWGVVATLALLPPLTVVSLRTDLLGPSPALQWLGYLSMGLSSIVLVMLLTLDALRLMRGGLLRLRPTPTAPDPSRRAFLGRAVNLGIVGGAGSVTGVGVVQARQLPDVQETEVPLKGLPPQAAGLRIVQISDVHVGPTIRGEYLAGVVDRVNALEPDIIAVTGDLIDGFVDQLR